MTRYSILLPATAVALLGALSSQAQETAAAAVTTGAVRPIPQSDQMFRKTIWRSIDLREKQNRPMYSDGKEISRVIVDAVKRGELTPYRGDSLTSTYTAKEMSANMSYPLEAPISVDGDDAGGDWGGGAPAAKKPAAKKAAANDGWGGGGGGGGWGAPVAAAAPKARRVPKKDANGNVVKDRRGRVIYVTEAAAAAAPPPPAPASSAEYRLKDLYQINMTEEMIFDKKRSRMYHQIKTLSLIVPATAPGNAAGIDKPVATFKYADLVKVFRANPQTAIWFNAQNDAQHKNLADAFELWLFNSYITKVSNPTGDALADQYGDKNGILAAQQTAADLVEYEYNLWSF